MAEPDRVITLVNIVVQFLLALSLFATPALVPLLATNFSFAMHILLIYTGALSRDSNWRCLPLS